VLIVWVTSIWLFWFFGFVSCDTKEDWLFFINKLYLTHIKVENGVSVYVYKEKHSV